MTREQQLRSVGISAEAYEDHVVIEVDRSFMTLSPREVEVFHGHLRKAYTDAMMTLRRGNRIQEASGVLA